MVQETRKRKRNRPRKRKSEIHGAPKKKRNYKWVVLMAFGMAFLGAVVGSVVDLKTASILGIIGLVFGVIGGIGFMWSENMPLKKGSENLLPHEYLGYNATNDDDGN